MSVATSNAGTTASTGTANIGTPASTPPSGGVSSAIVHAPESCPLCGTTLRDEQQWCLGCGAAARTRLAATPRWRAPVIALSVVIVLALGALTAALVSLAGQ